MAEVSQRWRSPFSHNQQTAHRERPPSTPQALWLLVPQAHSRQRAWGCQVRWPLSWRKKTRHGQAPRTVQPHQLELLPRAPRRWTTSHLPPGNLVPADTDKHGLLFQRGQLGRGSCEPGLGTSAPQFHHPRPGPPCSGLTGPQGNSEDCPAGRMMGDHPIHPGCDALWVHPWAWATVERGEKASSDRKRMPGGDEEGRQAVQRVPGPSRLLASCSKQALLPVLQTPATKP